MVKLVTVLSVSFPEDAGTGWQYVQMLVCVPLCARSEESWSPAQVADDL